MNKNYKAERNEKIYEMRISGATYLEISKKYNLSIIRIRQIVEAEQSRRFTGL